MAGEPDAEGRQGSSAVLIFENDPRQAESYRRLFMTHGYVAETALPDQDVQTICERLKPDLVIVDMAIWEADAAYVFGVLHSGLGFRRPVIIGLATLDTQVRRAKRFAADGVWIRGIDDASGLPPLAADLLAQRRSGALKERLPQTPL